MARYDAYPAVLYNAAGETVRVMSASEDEAMGNGWMSGHEYFSRLRAGTMGEESPQTEGEEGAGIEALTKKQLVEYAKEKYGIDLIGNKAAMLAAIKEAEEKASTPSE